ncbi:L-lactate dehydrogenase [Nymphon striatum]|nr:L-lactate dehydrogenase [Nymphon striatum]
MIGQDVAMPVALAPVGLTGMQHADGEIKAAKAAKAFGVPFTLSTMSINSIEDVAEATNAPFWFQLYTMRDADYVSRLIQRAKDAHCSALVITLDLQILGQRHKDLKNGLSAPPKLTPKTIANLMTKWTWGLQMLQAKRREFGNIVGHVDGISDASSLGAWTAEQFDLTLDWGKIAKLKEQWGGKVILKGILDAEDAKMALKVGADAIIVSNHGGRQLDGADQFDQRPALDFGRGRGSSREHLQHPVEIAPKNVSPKVDAPLSDQTMELLREVRAEGFHVI